MKSQEDYDKLYSQKHFHPTSCPGCYKKLTRIKKVGYKEIAFVCWNLGECHLALDLSKVKTWEVVSELK